MSDLHAISLDWQDFRPCLVVYDKDTGEVSDFDFWAVDFNVSHESRCVGSWHGGEYVPCPDSLIVKGGSVCDSCASAFIADLDCVFEPRCNGEECGMQFCAQEHAIYLAFHGHVAKVGLTASRRLKQRMIEQGADAYSVIAKVKGRKAARTMEIAIADELSLRQRVREIESLAAMTEPSSDEEIEADFAGLAERLENFGHSPSELRFLENYPIRLPLKRMPGMVKPGGRHRGKAIGVKGKFLIYENGGLNALNLQYLAGRFISDGRERAARPLECWQ